MPPATQPTPEAQKEARERAQRETDVAQALAARRQQPTPSGRSGQAYVPVEEARRAADCAYLRAELDSNRRLRNVLTTRRYYSTEDVEQMDARDAALAADYRRFCSRCRETSPMNDPAAALPSCVLALVFAAAVEAQSGVVQRCERKDGRVTYSNTHCPDGNRAGPQGQHRAADQRRGQEGRAGTREEGQPRPPSRSTRSSAQQEARDRKQADERAKVEAKADAKAQERCETPAATSSGRRRRAPNSNARAATVDKMQKADLEISRREADVARRSAPADQAARRAVARRH